MPKKKKPASCKTCNYIRSHKNNGINVDLMSGVAYRVITQRTGLSYETLKRHRDEGHMMERFLPRISCTKAAKEGLDLLKCATEIFMDCKDSAEKAKKKAEEKSGKARDFKDAMGCWDNAVKALSILKPEEKPQVNQTTTVNNYDNLSKEELRELVKLTAKIEGAEEGISEEKSD